MIIQNGVRLYCDLYLGESHLFAITTADLSYHLCDVTFDEAPSPADLCRAHGEFVTRRCSQDGGTDLRKTSSSSSKVSKGHDAELHFNRYPESNYTKS